MEDSSFITTKCARVWLQLECQLASLSAVPTIYLLDISGNFSQGHKLRLIEACRSQPLLILSDSRLIIGSLPVG